MQMSELSKFINSVDLELLNKVKQDLMLLAKDKRNKIKTRDIIDYVIDKVGLTGLLGGSITFLLFATLAIGAEIISPQSRISESILNVSATGFITVVLSLLPFLYGQLVEPKLTLQKILETFVDKHSSPQYINKMLDNFIKKIENLKNGYNEKYIPTKQEIDELLQIIEKNGISYSSAFQRNIDSSAVFRVDKFENILYELKKLYESHESKDTVKEKENENENENTVVKNNENKTKIRISFQEQEPSNEKNNKEQISTVTLDIFKGVEQTKPNVSQHARRM